MTEWEGVSIRLNPDGTNEAGRPAQDDHDHMRKCIGGHESVLETEDLVIFRGSNIIYIYVKEN